MIPTWILAAAPELSEVINIYRKAHEESEKDEHWCANDYYYNNIKPLIVRSVGFYSSHENLKTSEIYEEVVDGVLCELPNCKDCVCVKV